MRKNIKKTLVSSLILFLFLGIIFISAPLVNAQSLPSQKTLIDNFNVFTDAVRRYFDDKYLMTGADYSIAYDLKDAKWLEENVPDARLIQAYARFRQPDITETFIFWNGKTYIMPDDFNKFVSDAHLQIINEDDALGIADVYIKAWEPSGSEGIPAAVILQSARDIPQKVNPVPEEVAQQIKSPVIKRQDNGFVVDLYSWCEIGGWVREWHITISPKGLVTAQSNVIGEYVGDCIIEGAVRDRISPSYREYLLSQWMYPRAVHTKDVYVGGVKRFVIHWRDEDFTAASDGNATTVVNWVENAAITSWTTEIDNWKFNPPPDAVIDIYIWNNTAPWGPATAVMAPGDGPFHWSNATGEQFIYMTNNLSKWLATMNIYYPPPKQNVYTIVFSHEFFHAIQKGYKVLDTTRWIYEGTARFEQTVILPNAEFWQNSNLEELPGGPYNQDNTHRSLYIMDAVDYLSQPYISLYDQSYGACIYWRYMYEHHGGMENIRKVFEQIKADNPGGDFDKQIKAINKVYGVDDLDFGFFAIRNHEEFGNHSLARRDKYYQHSKCYYGNVFLTWSISYDAKSGPQSTPFTLADTYATDYIKITFKKDTTKDVNITFEENVLASKFSPCIQLFGPGTKRYVQGYWEVHKGKQTAESKIIEGVDQYATATMVVARRGKGDGKYSVILAGCPIVTKDTSVECFPIFGEPIVVEFNYKMNKSATEKAVSISPTIAVVGYSWTNGDKKLEIHPCVYLEEGKKYTVTIAETARSADDVGGMGLDGDKDGGAGPGYKFEFITGKFGVDVDATPKSITVKKGETAMYEVEVKNTGECKDNFTLTYSSGWAATLNPTKFTLVEPGKTVKATLKVTAPANGRECGEDSTITTVTATSEGNPKKKDSVSVKTIVDFGKCPDDTKCWAYKCENNKCKKIRKPGCDHPDENADVSTCSRCSQYRAFTENDNHSDPKIAVLSNGFPTYFLNLLAEFGESADLVSLDASSEELSKYSVFVIPTGGFYGISSIPSFKDKLEKYVSDGGTLIVLAQQHGYEYEPVPGDLSGYGWLEDQSCHYRSTGISTYHVILSGQDSVILDANVDGYFTKYPDNATVLLGRIKNGMPAMLMYEYGNGTVIVATLYTDWANSYRQATKDGKNLIRDMIAWAKDPKDIPDYAHGDAINIPINITNNANVTTDNVSFRVRDPDKNVVGYVNVTNVSILPDETKIINFTYTAPSKLGIWWIDYSLLNNSNVTQTVYEVQRFAVSKYAENPEGWVYQGKDITFSVTTPEERYPYGSDVPFTIHIWNKGDVDKNISFSTYYEDWSLKDVLSEQNIEGNLTVPAGGEATYTHILHVGDICLSHNQLIIRARFYEDGSHLGRTEKVVYMFHPSVSVNVETDQKEYAKGEDVFILLNLTNKRSAACNATVTVRTLDPDNKKIYEESFNINLSAYASENKTLNFSLPVDSKYGIYTVTAEAYSNGKKIGSDSTYFKVFRNYIVRVEFDRLNKLYRIRENISMDLEVINLGSTPWSSTVNVSIPAIGFNDSRDFTLDPNETEKVNYNLNIPETTPAGKHDVIVTISYDNSTKEDCFFIPESDLILSSDKSSYNAGENLSINLTNIGGVDTTFNCSIKFSDSRRFLIYKNSTQGNILAGENKTISFKIPDQAVNGDYQLIASCKDNKTGKIAKLSKSCEVSGLKAVVTSVTDKKAYFCDENVTILTNITNLDGAIVNGTLNLKIYSKSKQVKSKAKTMAFKTKAMAFDSDVDDIVTNVSYQENNSINDTNPGNINISNESTDVFKLTSTGGFGTTGTHIKLGIDSFAHIADYSLEYGLQYPVGTEHIAIGWWGEGFYFGYYIGETLHQGWSYEGWPYVSGLTFVSEEKTDTDTEGEYVVVLKSADGRLEITHDFLLHKSKKYVILKVDLKNIGSDKITGLKYRRICDWDMDGSPLNDYWDYLEDTDGKPIMMAWDIHYGALAPSSSTPADKWDADAWDDMNKYNASVDYADPNGLVFDGNVYFEWELADLNPDESKEIIMYYVLGDSKDEIISGYDAAEAEAGFPTAVIWEKNITVNLSESETKNIVTAINIQDELKNATGKLYLISTLYNHINSSQVINQSDRHSFFITDKNTSLTLETDKPVYKPNETVMIYGEVKNNALLTDDYNLSIKKDGVEIFADTFTLDPGESYNFTTNTSSNTSFTLEGVVDGVTVTDLVSVETASINVSIIAPDIVGLTEFDVGVLIENTGKIYADLNVSINSINSTWNITVPEGESRLLETTMNITKNTTLNVTISGDVNKTIQKEIIFGENAKIDITPADTYLEGTVEIPFIINNTGTLDSEFNATFSINPSSPDEQTISRRFFVPAGGNITDSVSFNLTRGAHLLRYTSPFEVVDTMINVLSPPEFNVTLIYPEERNFTIGENVILVFEVENIGGSEGEAVLTLKMPDFEETNRTWIRAGAKGNISFNFTIPDDLEEKSYKGIYELNGKRGEFSYSVQGANISVNASLDKNLYEEGETAVLTLTVKNNRNMDLSLYSRVKFNEYDNTTDFNLSAFESKTLLFNVPVNFDGDNKILYAVYMDTGRSLYINSIYVYEKKPDVPLRLYTDKDVYNMGDEVTINIVDVTRTDLLNLTAPNFTYNNTISGPTTLKFTLPELRSGTYYIEYTFGNFSSSYPFDVVGYSARILEADLDREKYYAGTVMKLRTNIEANKNVSGLLRTWIYGPDDELISEFETNETLRAGENKMEIDRCVLATKSGVHAIVYGFYADLSGHSLTPLVSGAEYFDATNVLNPDIPDMTLLSAGKNITGISVSRMNLSEIDETNKPPRIKSRYAYKVDSTIEGSKENFTLQLTNISYANLITAYKIDDEKHWIPLNTTTINRTTLSFTMSAGERDSTVVLASKEATIGGISVAILPKIKEANAGETCEFTVRVRNTQNFDAVVDMEVTLSGIPAEYQANLSWFNWLEYTSLVIPTGEYRDVSLRLNIPAGVSGEKCFGIVARGTFGESKDYGVINVR